MPRPSASATGRNSRRALLLAVALWLLPLGVGCPDRGSLRRPQDPGLERAEPVEIGVYKARVTREDGRSRRFRLLLYAESPDRLHAEAVAPVGGTQLIVDGNASRLSIALVRDKLAFAGQPTGADLERIVGSPVSPRELVQALLEGDPPSGQGIAVERTGPPGLPEGFTIRSGGHRLELELRRTERTTPHVGMLASGAPPDGFEIYPLSDLVWDWFGSE